MKFVVMAMWGMTENGSVTSNPPRRLVAVCSTMAQALDFVRDQMTRGYDPSVPYIEREWFSIHEQRVALPGFE